MDDEKAIKVRYSLMVHENRTNLQDNGGLLKFPERSVLL
jgi:hypothetical protein